jgi:hypothetical protein
MSILLASDCGSNEPLLESGVVCLHFSLTIYDMVLARNPLIIRFGIVFASYRTHLELLVAQARVSQFKCYVKTIQKL